MRRAVIAAIVAGGIAAGACGERGGEEAEEMVSADDEVAALDPALEGGLAPGTTLEMAEEGRRLFVVCAVCHGLDAAGTPLGPPLNDGEWTGISGELAEIESVIRTGVAEPEGFPVPMPAMGGGDFTDEQVRALAAYVYALGHATP